jgi:hypothetical protein
MQAFTFSYMKISPLPYFNTLLLLAAVLFASPLRAQLLTGEAMQNPFFTGADYSGWTLNSPWRADGGNDRLVFDIQADNPAGFFSASGAGIDLGTVAPSSPQARLMNFDFGLSQPFVAAFGAPETRGTYKLFFEVDVLTAGGTYRAQSQEFDNPLDLSGALTPVFTWQTGGGFLGDLPGNGGVLLSEINALNYSAFMWVDVPASGAGTGFFTLDNMSLIYEVDTVPEPSTYLLLGVAATLALAFRLRRRGQC